MPKKVTLKDIAAKAGLSPASVSMILNRRSIDRFNTETIKNVFALADSMGNKNSKHQSYALIKPSDTLIIIICPSLFIPSTQQLSRALKLLRVSRASLPLCAQRTGILIRSASLWSRLANSMLPA